MIRVCSEKKMSSNGHIWVLDFVPRDVKIQ
jgi:hypothetical protein